MSPEAGDTGQTFSEHTSQHWTGKRLPWRSGDGPLKEEKKKTTWEERQCPLASFLVHAGTVRLPNTVLFSPGTVPPLPPHTHN